MKKYESMISYVDMTAQKSNCGLRHWFASPKSHLQHLVCATSNIMISKPCKGLQRKLCLAPVTSLMTKI